ncbi:MAG: alpha-2-macroglobulin family protein, partial [Planctomycetota bacterium]
QPELLGELDRRARDFGGAAAAIWLVVIIALFIGLVVARFTPPEKRFARGVAAVTLAGVLASLGLTLWSSQGSDFMASGEDAAAEMAVAEASIGNQNYWTGPGDDRSLNLAGIELETELTRKLQSLGYPGAGGRRPEDGFALGREETVAEIDDDLIEEEELGTDFDEVLEEPAQEVAELDDLDVEAEEEPEADPAAAEWKPRAGGAGPPVPIPGRAANMRQLGYSDGSRADFESYARIYAHKRRSEVGRGDFQETVYWNALLKTDDSGKATVEFDVSDRVTTWEVGIDAHGAGRIGQALATFESKLPFHLEAKLPVEVAAGDRLQIPVAFSASDPELLSAALGFRVTDPLETDAPSSQEVPIRDGRGRVLLPIDVGELPGPARLTLNGSSGRFADRVERDLRVVPRGFPHHDSRSGLLKESVALDVRAPDSYHRGTLRARVKLYPSPLDDLGEGLEGMIQEPHGCFEQTSSTHYPNVLALQLIEATGIEAPAAAQRARGTIDRGIERLLGFECKSGGFEWFGHDPGHELLTAYGLLEFRDTQQVDGYIPAEIVERTRQWLLDHRTGNGDYRVRRDGLHSWFADPNLVNAYLTYSLVGTGVDAKALTAELDRLEQRLPVTEDAYEIGWIARALQAAERQSAADARRRLKSAQQSDGSVPGLGSSIVGSKGEGLIIETTALAALAWSDDEAFAGPRRQAVEYLLTKRHGNGSFGSTQATVLALKALVKQAELERRITQEGDFTVYLNDQLVDGRHVRAGHRGVIELDALGDRLEPGINRVRLELSGGNELPWSFELNYSSDQPADAVDVPVRISTEVAAAEVREGESVPVKVRVENVSGDDLPMTMAIVGLPASLTVSPKILDDLRDAGRFDFWETSGRDVVLYFRGMKKDQVREITLDTEASFPGETTGAASRTYPYYSPEQTSWAAPLHVRVNAE